MESPAEHRDGVLVISVWIDPETTEFRARILHSRPSDEDTHAAWAGSPDEVIDAVSAWLDGFAPGPRD